MLSYQQYKQLNESLYGAFNLGIKQNNILTPPIGATGASEITENSPEEDSIEEAKEEKGLTSAQKKLPKALQDAILKKKNKNHKDEDKEEKDEDKEEKGLTAAQKKLPKALQDAILKKQKSKKEWEEVMSDVESLLEDIKNQRVVQDVRNAMNQLKESISKKDMTEEEKAWWDSVNGQINS